jgi:hypothetical protein
MSTIKRYDVSQGLSPAIIDAMAGENPLAKGCLLPTTPKFRNNQYILFRLM